MCHQHFDGTNDNLFHLLCKPPLFYTYQEPRSGLRPEGAYLPPGGKVDSELAKLGQFRRRMRGKCHKFSRGFPSSVSGSFLAAASFPPRGSYGTFGAGAKSAHKHTDFHPACVRSLGDFQRVPHILGSRSTRFGFKKSNPVHVGHLLA